MANEPSQPELQPGSKLLKLGNLLARLSQSESKADTSELLEPTAERELWKRAALVRYFDELLFIAVLAAGLPQDLPATQFQHFITRSGVEAIPRTQNLYRLKDAVREEYLAAWREDAPTRSRELPAAQLACYRQLAEFYEKQGAAAQLDLLNCWLSFDQERARTLFSQLYDSAYANFDLPTCYTLLKMLDEHAFRLNPQLEQLRVQYRQFYNARSIFATEHYQSAVYFTRAHVRDAFAAFLAQQQEWIFQLYASGGMGKTIFLRWLIARYCIPAPHNIPVARLDFDFLPLAKIEKHPWLLLQPLAVQLNEQLPGFERLAVSPTGLREFAPLLREARSKEQQAEQDIAASKLETSGSYWQVQAPQEFANALAQGTPTKPVIIILDTLEEIELTRPATLLTMLEYFAGIQKQCPQLRLVLAGRYDLRVKIAGFGELYKNVATSIELTKFTEPEAVEYLRDKRQLADHLPLAAIAKRSEGIPFKLALFADLASTRESLTEEEVLNFPRADFAYLIERIIERVSEDDVRWVLRYGVLPRRLTRSFLENVMRQPLEAERTKSRRDLPNNLPQDAARYQHKELWRNQSTPLDLDQVWQHLQQYASGFGWITHEPASDSFKFQPEVRNPMRDLLQTQKIFPVLQKAAVKYFEKLARQNPAQWGEWMSEAVYHQFQLQGAKAATYWQEKIKEAEARQSPHAIKLLAADLTGPDYLDEGRPRQREDGRPIISAPVLRKAYYSAAEAAMQLAHEPSRRKAEWGFAYEQWVKLRALRPHQFTGLLPLILQAAEIMQTDQNAAAIPLLEQLLRLVKNKALKLSLAWQKAELQAALQPDEAEQSFKTALRWAEANPDLLIPPKIIRQRLASWYDQHHRFAEAEREYQALWEPLTKRWNHLTVAFALARLYLRYGQFAQARKIARQAAVVAKTPADQRALHLLSAEFELACRRPLAGLEFLAKAETFQMAATGADTAAGQELRGVLLGQLLDFAPAMEALEAATHLWGEMGNSEAQNRCRLYCAEIQLYGVGNLKEARAYLEAWRRAMTESSVTFESETRLRLELLYVEVQTRYGLVKDVGGGLEQWQAVTKFPWVNEVPEWRALTLATGVALGFADSEQLVNWVNTLARIEPASARLATLQPLRLLKTPPELSKSLRDTLRQLFGAEIRHACASKDAVADVISAADLYRLLGEDVPQFWALVHRNCDLWSVFAAREIRQAQDRWRRSLGKEFSEVLVNAPEEQEALRRYPMWEMANAIEQAERYFEQKRYGECEALVNAYKDRFNTSFPAHWYPRCRVLIGKLHQVKYHQEGNEEYLKLAEAAFSNAEELYNVLSDRLAAEQVGQLRQKLLSLAPLPQEESISFAGAEPPPAPIPEIPIKKGNVEAPAYTIRFQDRPPLRVGSNILRGKGNQAALAVPPKADESYPARQSLLAALAAMSRYEIFNWIEQQKPQELGAILFTRKEVVALHHGYYQEEDLQLCLSPGVLAALPWELARLPEGEPAFVRQFFRSLSRTTSQNSAFRETIKWAQIAGGILSEKKIIADGIYGPQFGAMLTSLQKQLSLSSFDGYLDQATMTAMVKALSERARFSARVAVIQPSQEEALRSQRGLQVECAALYHEHKFQVHTLSDPTWERLRELRAFDPQIIHLTTTMEESSRGGEIAIRLGRQDYVNASRLNQLFKEFRGDQMRPLIILDISRPANATEIWRQLALRNLFATELFNWENTGGIFATGLLESRDQEVVLERLIAGLAAGKSYGEIVSQLGPQTDPTADLRGVGATVLWSHDPRLSLLPPREEKLL